MEWSPVVYTSLGALLGFLGSIIVQRQSWKRESTLKMVDVIYGPLFREVNRVHESLKSFEKPMAGELEKIMSHYLYFMVDEELRKSLSHFSNRIKRYSTIYEALKGPANEIARKVAEENLEKEKLTDPHDLSIHYRLFVGHKYLAAISLSEALLKGKTPKGILESIKQGLKESRILIDVGGYDYSDLEAVDRVCEKALREIRETPIFQQTKKESKSIIQQSERIIRRIKPFIKL